MFLFEDLLIMAFCWLMGVITGTGLGKALGVQKHIDRERELDSDEESVVEVS